MTSLSGGCVACAMAESCPAAAQKTLCPEGPPVKTASLVLEALRTIGIPIAAAVLAWILSPQAWSQAARAALSAAVLLGSAGIICLLTQTLKKGIFSGNRSSSSVDRATAS